MQIDKFNPTSTPLNRGINLIEASAGTGKTYTIAMLVLRFVVEKDFNIEQLLVVTFTKAATEELKERIRVRLSQARALIHNPIQHRDWAIEQWLAQLSLPTSLIVERLDKALLNIDQASVFTIHSFCQRLLNDYALETGQLFNLELTPDSHALYQACTYDYWRKQLYPRTPLQVSLLIYQYKTPEDLLASITGLSTFVEVIPSTQPLASLLATAENLIEQAQLQFDRLIQILTAAFNDKKFKKSYQKNCEDSKIDLQQWLAGESFNVPSLDTFALFTEQGITGGLNAAKFKTIKTEASHVRKANYLKKLAIDTSAFAPLIDLLKQLSLHFRLGLVDDLKISLQAALQQRNQLTFDDLINRVYHTLQNDQSQLLVETLQQRFKVALIDEFQDTDDQQWTIFQKIFSAPRHFMYLIGDPKQAIYKFRGADIFSYFGAKETAEHPYTLASNWRTHPHLVTAVNQLFSMRTEPFLFEKLPFYKVDAALSADDGEIHQQQQMIAPMMLWQLATSDSTTGDWTAGKAAKVIQTAVVNEIFTLLVDDYSITKKTQCTTIKPKNIAILVRTNKQARDYQHALQYQGIPAVLSSIESVFASAQAVELYKLLQAVNNTSDLNLLKQALSLDCLGLNGDDFYALINDDRALEAWLSRFNEYHLLWQQQGFMGMILRLVAQEKVYETLAQQPFAERCLSNWHHLIEQVQLASIESSFTLEKTLEHLKNTIQEGNNDQQLRLESDDEAVKIMTMHRSKGLEFEVVFCPFVWHENNQKDPDSVQCHINGNMIQDLGSNTFESHAKKALEEQQAEGLRILYVALTRAKYRCYLAWANVRTKIRPNQSAFAYLMDFSGDNFEQQTHKLQTLKNEYNTCFDYQLIDPEISLTQFYQAKKATCSLKARMRKPFTQTHWTISSYTALSALSEPHSTDQNLKKTETLSLNPWSRLPKGTQMGNVIHNLLEFNSFKNLADPEFNLSLQCEQICLRYGVILDDFQLLIQLLQTIVSTPLSLDDTHFCLKNLNHWQCIKEMPFYLAIKPLNLRKINQLLTHCSAYQPLYEKELEGYLTGFIDLVCEYQGRYYVMDYKSNSLDSYEPEALMTAMQAHNYGLQYWLYSIVLHLYLQQRLPNYDYQQHFGGVRYLFVRGMGLENPLSGIYSDRPDLNTLNALSTLFIEN
ncbi:MAG: exodeoxyribonuclease V subunit beta [Methylococcales bacterium]|nr:exodeoxyribonuclease V subunit beta [Methylococcales bacterium]